MKDWFQIDKAGLAKILQRKGKEFALFELIQNAWDEEGVTEVKVTLTRAEQGYVLLTVEDDAPDGFSDLAHAYTLFAESKKKANPEKRGRFNLGEKLVLALAKEACISTTTGTVTFNSTGRRRSMQHRDSGSRISMLIRMTQDEMKHALESCNRLIAPCGDKTIITTINGAVLVSSPGIVNFKAPLTTEIADAEGHLVKSIRSTSVYVYPAVAGVPAAIYEMGIPVCEIDGKYIFNVCQKVPLTMDREEVLPSFRKQLAVAALNNLPNILDTDDANTAWATEAMTSPDVSPEAVQACMTQKFGVKRVIYDPSDPEANSIAAAAGFTVVTGGQLGKAAWANVKAFGAILPAGQVTPSPKPYSPDGPPLKLVKEMTPGMIEVETYAKRIAYVIMGANIHVKFAAEVTWPYAATYGPGSLVFNVGRLGKAWFDRKTNQEAIDNLIIHEFGHHYSLNHLSDEYYDALTLIGSKLAQAIRKGKL